jgi:hypothetical protein
VSSGGFGSVGVDSYRFFGGVSSGGFGSVGVDSYRLGSTGVGVDGYRIGRAGFDSVGSCSLGSVGFDSSSLGSLGFGSSSLGSLDRSRLSGPERRGDRLAGRFAGSRGLAGERSALVAGVRAAAGEPVSGFGAGRDLEQLLFSLSQEVVALVPGELAGTTVSGQSPRPGIGWGVSPSPRRDAGGLLGSCRVNSARARIEEPGALSAAPSVRLETSQIDVVAGWTTRERLWPPCGVQAAAKLLLR